MHELKMSFHAAFQMTSFWMLLELQILMRLAVCSTCSSYSI